MAGKYRIAVVGCGKVSEGHIGSWKKHPDDVDIVGLYDPVREFCQGQIKRFELTGARIYDSFDQVLADDTVDVVNLCSMSDVHDAQIAAAMDAGKHIMTEKPTGYSLEGCRRLRWCARKYPDLKVGVAYSLRYYPINMKVRKLVLGGAIGRPMWGHVEHHHPGHGSAPDRSPENRGIDHATDKGGRYIPGADMSHTTHPFDLARYLLGEPKEVYCVRNASGRYATITFVDESICQVQAGSTAKEGTGWVMPVMIQGTEGTIYTERIIRTRGEDPEHAAYLMNAKEDGGKIRKITAEKDSSHGDLSRARNFIGALSGECELICDLEDSVRTSELLHALWSSYSHGIRVPIQRLERVG